MSKIIISLTQFGANEYNCGAYGVNAYGQCEVTSGNSGNNGNGNGNPLDSLADTGYDVLIPIFLGISLLVAGTILGVKKLLRRRVQSKLGQ